MTKQMELTKQVAELLGWTTVVELDLGRLSGSDPDPSFDPGKKFRFVPSFATDVSACINWICQDERVRYWIITVDGIVLKKRNGIEFGPRHDNTAAGIAGAICQGFVELCNDER